MLINIQYNPTAQELAKASSLYVEKKPFFKYGVGFINIVVGIFTLIYGAKLCLMGLTLHEWAAAVFCVTWLFGRRAFNEWLLLRRMKNSLVIDRPIHIEMSLNGIAWSGKGLQPGSMPWEHLTYVLEAQNGFILPNSLTRFLWLPFRGFVAPTQIDEFKNFLMQRNIARKTFARWKC